MACHVMTSQIHIFVLFTIEPKIIFHLYLISSFYIESLLELIGTSICVVRRTLTQGEVSLFASFRYLQGKAAAVPNTDPLLEGL